MAIEKICQFCETDLVWYKRAACFVCPVVEDTPLVGLANPMKSPYVRNEIGNFGRNVPSPWTEKARHTTCLPGELFDEDLEIGVAILYARGGALPSPQAGGTTSDGRRQIVDSRGVPVRRGPGSREAMDTFQCEGCGFRSPARQRVMSHLASNVCESQRAEAPSGEAIDLTPTTLGPQSMW